MTRDTWGVFFGWVILCLVSGMVLGFLVNLAQPSMAACRALHLC